MQIKEKHLYSLYILITVMMGNSHSEPLNSNKCYDQRNMQAQTASFQKRKRIRTQLDSHIIMK